YPLVDTLLPFRTGQRGDRGLHDTEVLLFLEIHLVPWRIAEHAGKAARPSGQRISVLAGTFIRNREDLRKLQMPMEETIFAAEPVDLVVGGLRRGLRVPVLQCEEDVLRY